MARLGEVDDAGVRAAFRAVADAVVLVQPGGGGLQLPGQNVGFGLTVEAVFQTVQQLGRGALPLVTVGDQFLHGQEKLARTLLRFLPAVVDELPVLVFVKLQAQLEIRQLPAGHVQGGGLADARGLLENHGPVRAAHETVGAGDHVERVLRLLLAGVVYHQDRDVEAVGDGLQRSHDHVIPRVAVLLRLHLPDALQRVDDHEAHARVGGQKVTQLLLEAVAQKLRLGGDPDPVGLAAGDFTQPLLDALGRVLQADVQNLAGCRLEVPDLLALADPVGQPEYQPALADLAGPGQDVHALAQQLFDEKVGRRKLRVHKVVCVHRVQLRDPFAQRALDVADGIQRRHARMLIPDVVQQVAALSAAQASPGVILHEPRLVAADRADRGEPVRRYVDPGGFQILTQPGPQPLP